jgi:hypothetical protein
MIPLDRKIVKKSPVYVVGQLSSRTFRGKSATYFIA